jgi:hypothetical protein
MRKIRFENNARQKSLPSLPKELRIFAIINSAIAQFEGEKSRKNYGKSELSSLGNM